MYFGYAISSKTRNYIYVGITDNLERRVTQRNKGQSKTTKPYRLFDLIYTEIAQTRQEARNREKYLESGVGKELLKSL